MMRTLPQFRVMKKQCDECLFADSDANDRRQDVLELCADEGRHFICSKVSALCSQNQLAQEQGDICCRGFYDRDPGATIKMRLAHILNIVVFVDIPAVE